jgi:sec-independent protein translocase protein TatC
MSDVELDEVESSSAPLIEHLTELRTRIMRSLFAFIIGVVIVFIFAEPLLDFVMFPIQRVLTNMGQAADLIFTAPHEYFFTLFRIAMIGGFMLSFPVIAHQMWRFVAPGLYSNEKGAFLPFIIASPVLFLAGASFAHYVVTPLAMGFFIGFADIIPAITSVVSGSSDVAVEGSTPRYLFLGSVKESLNLTLKFIFAFGLCFQLPVLLTLLGKAGLVSAQGLRDVRKYAVVGILTLAAVVTPPDVVTQVILFTVVYMLYEFSILLVSMVEKKREDQLRADGYYDDEDDA